MPKGLRALRFSFADSQLTHYGGMVLMQRFFNPLRLLWRLQKHVPLPRRAGYNPKKKGRRSYHPLLCFEAHRQEFWHGSLRPGDSAANTGVVPFLQRCLAKVASPLARSRIRVRADAGFFSGKLIGFLDQTRL